VASVLYALLFLPALLAIVYLVTHRTRTLEEAVIEPENPFEALDSILTRLESGTLGGRDLAELEQLAEELEQAARQLERVA
jgi:hypothetical protein